MRKFTTALLVFLFCAGMNFLYAQTRTISGTVTDDEGAALPGVSVVVTGTTTGTVTNLNGKYSLNVGPDAKTLTFSFVGKKKQEITIGGSNVINVVMQSTAFAISEVVVTAIGITRQTKALGYSVSTVKTDNADREAQPDLIRSIAGKVAGVDITSSSGVPGSSTRITIRGNSSFYGNNQPLFIVDGVPYSNQNFVTSEIGTSEGAYNALSSGGGAYASGISTLDPNDIKSMTVLKGAAAAALYGSRASNGVIVIETKSGNAEVKKGIEVTLSSGLAFEQISNLPNYQNTFGNGVDFQYLNANGSWGPRFDSQDSMEVWSPVYASLLGIKGDSLPYVAQPNNVKDLFNTGHVFTNSVTITGGTKNSNISMTASTLGNDGYIPYSSFKRKSITFGGNTKLSFGLRLNGSFSYTTSTQVGGRFGNNQSSAPETASSFARTLWLGRDWIMNPYTDPATGASLTPNGTQFDNPLWSWKHNTITTNVDRMVFNVKLDYKITSYLSANALFGSNTFMQRRLEIIDIGSRALDGEGALTTDDVRTNEITADAMLVFNKNLTKDIDLSARVGWSLNQRTEDRKSVFGKGLIAPDIFTLDNCKSLTPNGSVNSERRLYGFFYDLSFSYKSFWFLNFTGRNDVSSTLPIDNRSYFYPAFSTSFILSQALGITNKTLNFLKVRASWAKVGSDADPYLVNTTYPLRGNVWGFPFIGIPGQTVSNTLLDPNLTPEFTKEGSVGTDVTLFNTRVKLDFTYYHKVTTRQIVTIQIPASSGYNYFHTNAGAIKNTGVEIGLDLIPLQLANGFTWDIYTTFTKNNSKVTALPKGSDRVILAELFDDPVPVFEVGQPYGILRGSVDYRDANGNLLIDPKTGLLIKSTKLQTIGDPNPDYLMGVTNTFTYKGFSLSFMFNYTHGGDFFSNSILSLLGRGVTKDTKNREHNFIIPGYYGNPNTGKPILDANGNEIRNVTQVSMNDLYFGESFAINTSTYWNIYDATVLRLSNVSLSYAIPKKLLKKLPISGLTITVTGNNLWYFAPHVPKYTNFDPELNGYGNSNVQGIEYSNAPSVRRYGVNIRITL